MLTKASFSLLLFICLLPLSHAEIYRWVDDNGKIQFSDRPSARDSKAEQVKVNTQRNSYGGGGLLERQKDLLDGYQAKDAQKVKDKQQAKRQAAQDKRLQTRCLNAKDRLKNYQRSALYRLDNKGERIYYSEEQRSKAIAKFQQLIQKNC
jgi:hypothetical protein